MSGGRRSDALRTNRRAVLAGIAAAAAAPLSGCSSDGDSADRERAEPVGSESSGTGTHRPEAFVAAREEAESVYGRLNAVPAVVDGEFAFDVVAFEDDYDHREVLSDARKLRERVDALDAADLPEAERNGLRVAAELAEPLVRQRLFLHQALVAGVAFGDRFASAEFDAATATIRDARGYLRSLAASGERVETVLNGRERGGPEIEGYDPASIEAAQEVLVEVARWANPAYEGLERSVLGFERFVAANDAMEAERFGRARDRFRSARTHFEAATDAFDRSQGRGRRVGYVAPTVDGIRCVVPAYLDGCERLGDAFDELDAGNRERGFGIAREALRELDGKVARCIESGERSG